MSCESTRQLLLDIAPSADARRAVAGALGHLDGCDACRAAVRDFDRLSTALHAPADAGGAAAEPAGGWAAFERRLHAEIGAAATRDVGPVAVSTMAAAAAAASPWGVAGRPTRWHRWVVATAASVLAGWAGFWLGAGFHSGVAIDRPAPTGPTSPVARALGADEVARQVRAFSAVDEFFDGRTRWLLLAADASDVGLTGKPTTTATPAAAVPPGVVPQHNPTGPQGGGPGRTLLLVRLNLTRGSAVVSDADVVMVAGTTAMVAVPVADGPPLRYRIDTSAADPMRLAVRLEVPEPAPSAGGPAPDAPAPDDRAVLGTSLRLEPYRDAPAGRLVTARGAFDLKVAAASAALSPAVPAPSPDTGGKL